MNPLSKTLLGVVLLASAGLANASIMFDFSWSSAGSTPATAGTSATASGTFTVDKAAGESFTGTDISALGITVVSDALGSIAFGLSDIVVFSGSILASGVSVDFTDVYLTDGATKLFACATTDCSSGVVRIEKNIASFQREDYDFGSQSAAQGSFESAAVPEPTTLALMGLGLAGIGYQRKHSSKKAA